MGLETSEPRELGAVSEGLSAPSVLQDRPFLEILFQYTPDRAQSLIFFSLSLTFILFFFCSFF